jgi:phosphoenolpyruvate carboxylase
VLEVTGAERLLGHRPVLGRAVDLRNPYVDALSFLQVRFLAELRKVAGEDAGRMADLVLLTVNGVAAGLQNTG